MIDFVTPLVLGKHLMVKVIKIFLNIWIYSILQYINYYNILTKLYTVYVWDRFEKATLLFLLYDKLC
jgi:hypothetical protein